MSRLVRTEERTLSRPRVNKLLLSQEEWWESSAIIETEVFELITRMNNTVPVRCLERRVQFQEKIDE